MYIYIYIIYICFKKKAITFKKRLPKCLIPSDGDMKKEEGRVAYVATIESVELSDLSWYDEIIVILLAKFAGSQPLTKVKRLSKKEK